MRRLALFVLLATPVATAWSVHIDAPAEAAEATPFRARVCAESDGARGQMRVLAENATIDAREDRYLPAFDIRECRDFDVTPTSGVVRLEARVRAEGGSAPITRAYANVSVAPAPPMDLRIVDVHEKPHEGIILQNVGADPVSLVPLRLNGKPFSNRTIDAGATVFIPYDVRAGQLALTFGEREIASLLVPKLRAGEGLLGKYGRTNVTGHAMRIEGSVLAYATSVAPVVELIDAARGEVLVESYTLTSPDVAAALARAADRGARVRVLLEGAPVGGVPADERALVATLTARGVEVMRLGGEGARYRTVHSKLVVADRAGASVATENLGEGNARGYGLVVHNASLASAIADVILADLDGHDVTPFKVADSPADALARVGVEVDARRFEGVWNVSLVLSPDDPSALARAVSSARSSVRVEMLRAEPDGPMIDALVAAARAGAHVHLLLDGRFDDGTNRETVARLQALAERDGLELETKLDRADRTLHAKAVVIDGRLAYVGSMNWVRAAWEDNREAGVLIESGEVAAWFEEEMQKDWAGPPEEVQGVPAPPGAMMVLALSVLALLRGPSQAGRGRARRRTRSAARGGSRGTSWRRR